MGRPFKDALAEKHDRIIAKVYHQLLRWGFSGTVTAPVIARVAYSTLGRANKQLGNGGLGHSEDDLLTAGYIKDLYKLWCKKNPPYFSRENYPKVALQFTGAPKKEDLEEVIKFFIKYMNQEPEQCIFKKPPEWNGAGCWWRMYDGELDGDLPLSPKAQVRADNFPKIKRKK